MGQNGSVGKAAVITGASSGLGAAAARHLAARGALVALGARRGERLDTRWQAPLPPLAAKRWPCPPT